MNFLDKLKKAADTLEDMVEDINEQLVGDYVLCPKCNTKSEVGTKFCGSCGADLTGVAVTEGIKSKAEAAQETQAATAAQQSAPTQKTLTNTYGISPLYFNTDADLEAKFDGILASDFAAYEIKKSATAESLGLSAQSPCKPYDYAMFKGGRLVAVIMLTPKNRDTNMAFKNAKSAASRISFINFYTNMDNETGYVKQRIKSFL